MREPALEPGSLAAQDPKSFQHGAQSRRQCNVKSSHAFARPHGQTVKASSWVWDPPVGVFVTVTLRGPSAAAAPIVMLALAWVELMTLTLLTVIPSPKSNVVTPE